MELKSYSHSSSNSAALRFSDEELRLVAAWRHEVFHIASTTALVTLSLNAMADDDSPESVVVSEINTPDEAAINRAMIEGLLEMPSGISAAFQSVASAYDKLTLAIDLHSAFSSERHDPFLTLGCVKKTWQIACKQFLMTLGNFETREFADVSLLNSSAYTTHQVWILRGLLQAGTAGETFQSANINFRQSLHGPHLNIPRRRWDRRNMNLQCQVSSAGYSQSARMCNVSVGGALLDGIDCFARGVRIHIFTDCNRNLDGAVVWAADGKTGVKFNVPLSLSDPILSSTTGNS